MVPQTEIYILLTPLAISLPSNFLAWKAVSNYTKTFPLCITAHSRLSSHYTNSSNVLGRSPLKQVVPLLPAWFPQHKSSSRGMGRAKACNAAMPSCSSPLSVTHALPALLPCGFLPSQPISGQALTDAVMHQDSKRAPSTPYPGLRETVILPLDWWRLLHDASGFTENKQGWSPWELHLLSRTSSTGRIRACVNKEGNNYKWVINWAEVEKESRSRTETQKEKCLSFFVDAEVSILHLKE